MKFRTEVDVKPFSRKIGYETSLIFLGSCFADNMAGIMQRSKFRVTANPAGVLFNPASIAETLRLFDTRYAVSSDDLTESGGKYFDYRFHGSFADSSAERSVGKINEAVDSGHKALRECDIAVLTFGTAWVYILNETGKIVANCHKQPSSLFTRRRLSVDEIVASYSELFDGILKDKSIIMTVSPVRHLGDGAEENFTSKATLKLAVAELVERYPNVVYFPAYEIVNDDLRDYRFYADDLVHPSAQAVAYIKEKFFDAALSERTKQLLVRVEKIAGAAEHRPFDSSGDAFAAFCRRNLDEISVLEQEVSGIDLSAEKKYFADFLK